MSRLLRSTLPLLAALALTPIAATALAAPVAHAAKSCSIRKSGHGFGYTYLTALSVSHTSCATGDHVAKRHGKVHGWHCSTKRLATSSIQYQARETCKNGSKRVVWSFSQNT